MSNILENSEIDQLNHLSKILRGFIFTAVEAGQSGHPGGSSSKVEQILALLFNSDLAFDAINPKHPGRDRIIWSAGHCTPLLFAVNALIYECMRRNGRQFATAVVKSIMPEDLLRFRHLDGPQGHAESNHPLSDYGTGPSGHGLSAAGGMAIAHQSCGLPTKIWVLMGDAESEEGMTYEARNVLKTVGTNNLIVSLDYNHFGIDGTIEEVVSSDYVGQWKAMGWNVLKCDGHNVAEISDAYAKARALNNNLPTVVICHTIKGKNYGSVENSATSHGAPIKHEEYLKVMQNLGFDLSYKTENCAGYLSAILSQISIDDEKYICAKMEKCAERILSENTLIEKMETALASRPLQDHKKIARPKKLPKEINFESEKNISTRKACQAFLEWMQTQTAFCWVGAGDVGKSVLTDKAEKIYGIINPQNKLGRGIRFGIAEQNMAMMSTGLTHDILPGDFRPMSVFGTFAVFTSMMSNCVRLATINNQQNPERNGFFIMLASHDGPETGEDGPTHQGLYWMSYFSALPGIKVYKPLDGAETVEMLFHAISIGEPIALSLMRIEAPIFDRKKYGHSTPSDANKGAYIFKPFRFSFKKKLTLCVSGGVMLKNILEKLPQLEKNYNIKIVAVTSPQLFAQYQKSNPEDAEKIFSQKDRARAITLHNGWKGFLDDFLLPKNKRIGVEKYLKSGNADELYELAGLSPEKIYNQITNYAK